MGPVEGVLVSTGVAVALVGVGYLLGRHWPVRRGPDLPQRPPAQRNPSQGPAAISGTVSARPSRPPRQREMDERLRREMEHVRSLRLARENAEPWRPPVVDAVDAAGPAAGFADTTVESCGPGRTP